jgi:O-antigen/teichoic acid export membrane protein
VSPHDEAAAPARNAAIEPEAKPGRLGSVARNLTIVNVSLTLAAVVTSPLQARALGPAGRGDLAAVFVVSGLMALLGDLGLGAYVVRESARGAPVRRLVGSVGPMMLVLGLLYAAAGPFLAPLFAGDRSTVRWLLLISFLVAPVVIPSGLTTAIVWGEQRWLLYALQRMTQPVGSLVVFTILYVLGDLTVASAGVTIIILAVAGQLPGYVVLRGAGRPERDRAIAADARHYGRRVWLTLLANQTNARLDQLLMTRLVASSQLGLYVVAVNLSLLQNSFTSAVSSALLPRVAAGDPELAARAMRVVVALISLFALGLFVAVPVIVPVVFGEDFAGAVSMCQILVLAAIPFSVVQLSTATLNGIGYPAIAARGELLSIGITVPALVAFVGRYGGQAAAVTSVLAYSVTALYLVRHVRRLIGVSWRTLFIIKRSDLRALAVLPVVGRIFAR